MANIVTKMLLDDKEYTTKLNKAKQNTSEFKKEVDAMGKKMSGDIVKGFTAVGVAIGVAGGAMETFKKFVNATNEGADKWDATLRGLTNSVNAFFTALRSGDFTSFSMGLDALYEKGKLAAQALDALGNATMSFDYFSSQYSAQFAEAVTTMRDTQAGAADREAAKATAEKLLGKQTEIVGQLKIKVTNAIQSLMTETNHLSAGAVGILDLNTILGLDIMSYGEDEKQRLAQEYKKYLEDVQRIAVPQKVVGRTATGMAITKNDYSTSEYQKQLAAVASNYKDAILYNELLVNKSDEWLQNLIAIAKQAFSAEQSLAGMERMLNRAGNSIKGGSGSSDIVHDTLGGMGSASGLSSAGRPAGAASIATPEAVAIKQVAKEYVDFDGIYQELIEDENKLERLNAKSADGWYNVADAMAGVGDIARALSGALNEDAAAWLNYAANAVQSVSAVVQSIGVLVASAQARKQAEAEAAIAGAASSVASVPIVGWATALAAVGSMIAAFSSIPKFATGGIVPGSSFTGDNVLARVNSGEMILNRDQQALLSQRLNGGGAKVEFFIQGQNLRGLLTNQITLDSRRL
uniref:Uncharacterized protein n=1 Tax=uncultured bacterium fosmid pJB83B9 TaxID=1478070 RepID=A0A0H3U856_9BACT|nr:hypothetical protein [uncultured bacterium fosmid pJB83B9]